MTRDEALAALDAFDVQPWLESTNSDERAQLQQHYAAQVRTLLAQLEVG